MKVLHAIDGWPPETDGPAQRALGALLPALAARGVESVVLAASSGDAGERTVHGARVLACVRADRLPEHWQKSLSATAAARLHEVLRAERPDVLHVHHWRRLSRDLVLVAARERVPAVVSLHDAWIGCLVGDRVRRDASAPDGARCAAPLGALPCLACADEGLQRTPWVPLEARFLLLGERRRDLALELSRARAVLVRSPEAERDVRAALGDDVARIAFAHVGCADGSAHAHSYAAVAAQGAPEVPAAADWWAERMQREAERAWDDALARALAADSAPREPGSR